MEFTPPFGQWLKQRRRQLDLTQGDLARRVGYSPETIRKIEAEALKPSKQIVDLLADHLGIPSSRRDAFLAFATGARTVRSQPKPNNLPVPARSQRKHNLPAPLTSFIGRERELEEITSLLQTTRLLTLAGTGGIGKTRLAIEVAMRASDKFPDGIWLVELALTCDPTRLSEVVVQTLKLIDQSGRDHLDAVCDYFEFKQALLIMDNCEHAIDAVAELINALLRRCPGLSVLATSREMLRLSGETIYHVPSLSLPGDMRLSLDKARTAESIRLFEARAQAQQPKFQLTDANVASVVHICRHLDGIPLALELVAALMHSLSTQEIADRLDGHLAIGTGSFRASTPRHQTMRRALDWSYDLLASDEQRTLARLSVFAGGCALGAATSVAEADLWMLDQLVRKSLVLVELVGDETRYRLLEPVRQYAAEKLEDMGATNKICHRHAMEYLALAQAAEPHLHGREQKHWLDRLEREHDNFRAALKWSRSAKETNPDLGLMLAVALWQFWWRRGYLTEGGRWIDELRKTSSPNTPTTVKAWAALASGLLSMNYTRSRGFTSSGISHFEVALALFLTTDDDAGTALSLCEWAMSTYKKDHQGHTAPETLSIVQHSLYVSRRQHKQPWITLRILTCLAFTLHWLGDLSQSTVLCEECVTLARQEGDAQSLSTSLILMADILGSQLHFARAARLAEEALVVSRQIGDVLHELSALRQFADQLRFLGEFEQATTLIEEMYALSLDRGFVPSTGVALNMFGLIARDQGDYQRAESFFREGILWCRDKMTTWRWWDVLALGTVASAQGQFQRAARIYGAIDTWQTGINLMCFPHNQLQFGTYIEATRAQLGEAAYSTAFEQGRAMTPEQAVEYALSEED